jgi:lysozyme
MAEGHRRTGLWPVINTQPIWWDTCTGKSRAFGADQLWVQDHRPAIRRPVLPSGWRSWAYWQYSITGRVPGVTGNTDLSTLSPALLAVANPR